MLRGLPRNQNILSYECLVDLPRDCLFLKNLRRKVDGDAKLDFLV